MVSIFGLKLGGEKKEQKIERRYGGTASGGRRAEPGQTGEPQYFGTNPTLARSLTSEMYSEPPRPGSSMSYRTMSTSNLSIHRSNTMAAASMYDLSNPLYADSWRYSSVKPTASNPNLSMLFRNSSMSTLGPSGLPPRPSTSSGQRSVISSLDVQFGKDISRTPTLRSPLSQMFAQNLKDGQGSAENQGGPTAPGSPLNSQLKRQKSAPGLSDVPSQVPTATMPTPPQVPTRSFTLPHITTDKSAFPTIQTPEMSPPMTAHAPVRTPPSPPQSIKAEERETEPVLVKPVFPSRSEERPSSRGSSRQGMTGMSGGRNFNESVIAPRPTPIPSPPLSIAGSSEEKTPNGLTRAATNQWGEPVIQNVQAKHETKISLSRKRSSTAKAEMAEETLEQMPDTRPGLGPVQRPRTANGRTQQRAHRPEPLNLFPADKSAGPQSAPLSVTPRPLDQRPMYERPTEQRPRDQRPMDQRPREQRPMDQRPMDQRPMDQRPREQRPLDQRPRDQRPVDQRPMDQRPREQRPMDQRPMDQRPRDQRPIDQRPRDQRPMDQRPMDPRPRDQRPMDQRPMDQRPREQRPMNQRPMDQRPMAQRPMGPNQRPADFGGNQAGRPPPPNRDAPHPPPGSRTRNALPNTHRVPRPRPDEYSYFKQALGPSPAGSPDVDGARTPDSPMLPLTGPLATKPQSHSPRQQEWDPEFRFPDYSVLLDDYVDDEPAGHYRGTSVASVSAARHAPAASDLSGSSYSSGCASIDRPRFADRADSPFSIPSFSRPLQTANPRVSPQRAHELNNSTSLRGPAPASRPPPPQRAHTGGRDPREMQRQAMPGFI